MNYQKLDASLAMTLDDMQDREQRSLQVFIHTEPVPDATATALLERLGVSGVTSGRDVFTAALSVNAIAQLSDQPWVQYIKLSQKLHVASR